MDYQEQNVAGKKWRRCYQIIIFNHKNEVPSIQFNQEDIYELENDEIKKQSGMISDTFDPTKTFSIVNPETLEPTEQTMTYAEMYHLLLSAYLSVARS